MDRRETGTKLANLHTLSPSPHTLRIHTQIRKEYSAIITQMRMEELVSVTFYVSDECQNLMIPDAHTETITKRYGMSCRTAYSTTIYDRPLKPKKERSAQEGYRLEENAVISSFCSDSAEVHVENRSFWTILKFKEVSIKL